MIVVFPFSTVDEDLALKNAKWWNELGGCRGHEALVCYDARCTPATVEAIGQEMLKCFDKVHRLIAQAAVDGWPEGANYFFRLCASWLDARTGKYPCYLWMEPDAIPLREGWLEKLVLEYNAAKKPFMGDRVAVEDIPVHMSGIGFYQNPIHRLAGEAYRAADTAWDMAAKDQIIPNAHFTRLIEHAWKHPKFTSIDELRTQIRPEAVLFHASKDGSLIDILRDSSTKSSRQIADRSAVQVSGHAPNGLSGREVGATLLPQPQSEVHAGSSPVQAAIFDIFIRTYEPDYEWLEQCVKSIDTFATGFRKVWIISPNNPPAWMLERTKQATAIEIHWRILNDESPDGYLSQQITKLYADHITDYQADYILHIDSDVILTKPVTPLDFFEGDKLVMPYTPYAVIETPWQPITEKFMDRPVVNEFMRRFPIMVPRWLYPRIREFCFKLHKVPLGEYIRSQPLRAFSEFNVIGAYAWEYHRAMFHWINTHENPLPEPFGKQFHSWSGLTPEIKTEIDNLLAQGSQVVRREPHKLTIAGSIPAPAIKTLPNGVWVIEDDTHISKWIEQQGRLDHDQNTLPFILPHLKPGDVVIDGGAFVGDHTIVYSKAVGSKGVVHAFEPNPVAFKCLLHNMATCGNVVIHEAGLSDKAGSIPLSGNNNNYGGCYSGDHMKIADVPVKTLDECFNGTHIDFIKLDIEGMEVNALHGGEKLITASRPRMVIEINSVALARQGRTPNEIFDWLTEHDYDFHIMQENCTWSDPMYDIVCLPKQPPGVSPPHRRVAHITAPTPVASPSETREQIKEHIRWIKEICNSSPQNKAAVMQQLVYAGLKKPIHKKKKKKK